MFYFKKDIANNIKANNRMSQKIAKLLLMAELPHER